MPDPRPPFTLVGYAVISSDGWIADAEGAMPDALRFPADRDHFQAGLDAADVTLLGRRTHEAAPNVKHRRRLVVSGRVPGLVRQDSRIWWINPGKADLRAALARCADRTGRVAVVGGTGVFDLILAGPGFAAFQVSLAHRVRLGRGRPLFASAAGPGKALSMLEHRGMTLQTRSWLDRKAGLELLVYGRITGAADRPGPDR